VLAATGRWPEAEEEFELALRLFSDGHRGMRVIALSRLADLRIKQGRIEEAAVLLEGYEEHPLAIRAATRLNLAMGRPSLAAGLVRRRLDMVGIDSLLAAPLLSLLVDAQLAIGNVRSATENAVALEQLAARTGQRSIQADAEFALGATAVAAARPDGLRHVERAIELYGQMEQPLEQAHARVLAAKAVVHEDRDIAVAYIKSALVTLDRLGARRDFDAAAEELRRLGAALPPRVRPAGVLTQREHEVLRLVAQGLSNAEIGSRLFISPKTAEHHVGNALRKLGLRSRVQAAAYLARHL
jgi:DNA-binding CsgD family transcriptional regulator